MRVVLDATVFLSDPLQRGIAWKALMRASHALRVRVFVPVAVVTEAVAGYRRNVQEMRTHVEAVQTKWEGRHIVVPSVSALLAELDQIESTYEAELKMRLRKARIAILPIPVIRHRDLVERAANRRKPNDSHGDGYRDTLNWLSVLSLAKKDTDPVVWVSNNTRDFANEAGDDFHPDLVEEMELAGVRGIVSLRTSLDGLELPRPVGDESFQDMDDTRLELMMSDEVHLQFASPAFLKKIRVRDEELSIAARRGRVSIVELVQLSSLTTHLLTVGEGTATGTFTLAGQFRIEYRELPEHGSPRATLQSVTLDLMFEGQVELTPNAYSEVDIATVSLVSATQALADSYRLLAEWAAQGLLDWKPETDWTRFAAAFAPKDTFGSAIPDMTALTSFVESRHKFAGPDLVKFASELGSIQIFDAKRWPLTSAKNPNDPEIDQRDSPEIQGEAEPSADAQDAKPDADGSNPSGI